MPVAPAGGTRVVGRYEITSEIGRGGAAIVHLARQLDLDRQVALKELSVSNTTPPDFARRFLRESRVAGSLSHPNIVTVYEYLEHDGVPYIVMEFLPRGSLRPFVGNLAPAALAGVLEGVLAGLMCAESSGVVHRDLKPENILVTADGRVKLADFGIAKATKEVGTDLYVTEVGMTVGTPSYMAPEQALGEAVGPWTDLYSVGVMTWEQLVGRVPFSETRNPTAVLLRHVNETIPPAISVRADVDPALSGWVETLTANEPRQRVQTAAEAWDSLEQIVIAQLGPVWRREARLPSGQSPGAPSQVTPVPADQFGTYAVIERGLPEPPAAPAPVPGRAPPAYHTYMGEQPSVPSPEEPPSPPPVVTPVARRITLQPEAISVRPGERTTITATLAGDPATGIDWDTTGSASSFATVQATPTGALVELHPGIGEPPWSSSLEIRCLERGVVAASATATVEVLAEVTIAPRPIVTPAPAPGPAGHAPPEAPAWRTPALAVAIGACLVFIAALCLSPLAYLVDTGGGDLSSERDERHHPRPAASPRYVHAADRPRGCCSLTARAEPALPQAVPVDRRGRGVNRAAGVFAPCWWHVPG
jgi:serine/threonine protein kinase